MLFKNTLAQSVALVSGNVLSVVIAPIMLKHLGLAQFGVWAVSGAMATYAGLADFGITRSLARFVALYDSEGDERAIKECLGLGLIAITLVGLIACVAALIAAPILAHNLGVLKVSQMRLLLLSSVGIFVFQAYRRVLNSLETGLRRMVPPNIANVFTIFVNFGFSVTTLLVHPTLVAYGAANAASYVVGIGASLVSVLYVWHSIPIAFPSWARAKEIGGFGFKSQLHFLADLINLQTDKVIIAFFVGVRAAAAYEIAARVVVAVRAIGLLTISAMIPTLTARIVTQGRESIASFYRRYLRLSVGLAFPVFVLTCISAPYLLKAWLGQVPGHGPLVVVFLTFAYFVSITTEVGRNVAVADGDPGLVAQNSVIAAALNVALTALLAPIFGFWGVLVGTVVALAAGTMLFVFRYHRRYHTPMAEYWRAVMPPAALAWGLAVPFAAWGIVSGTPDSRASAAISLACVAALYGGGYWIAASRFDFLPARLTAPFGRRRRIRPATG